MKYSERQIEIIEAATSLIDEGGIQNITTKSLAKKMHFSEPAIYRHFSNKTEILSSILGYFSQSIKSKTASIVARDSSGLKKLENIIQFQFNHLSKNPAIVMVIFSETSFQNNEKLSMIVKKIMNNKKKTITSIIEKGQKDKSIRDDISPAQLASIFVGSMRFTILQWRLNNYKSDLTKDGLLLWETLKLLLIK